MEKQRKRKDGFAFFSSSFLSFVLDAPKESKRTKKKLVEESSWFSGER